MKTLKIKSADFINWFFRTGSDQDQEREIIDLGSQVVETLMHGEFTITPSDILSQCEITVIPMNIVQGFENEDPCYEIGDAISEGVFGGDEIEIGLI